jgi:hypothetical protein
MYTQYLQNAVDVAGVAEVLQSGHMKVRLDGRFLRLAIAVPQ